MFIELLFLLISLVVLAKSSDVVTDKAIILSDYFGISRVAIGFLLLAGSTSLPEFSVAVVSSIMGNGAISAGNVFGANIADVLLILGICAGTYGLVLNREDAAEILAVLLVTSAIMLYFIYSTVILNTPVIERPEGILLLLAFAAYIFYMMKKRKTPNIDGKSVSKKEALNAFLIFFLGTGLVLLSAGLAVDSVSRLSELAGISRSFLGATLVSLGTTLPELSVSLSAARKKEYSLSFGNAVGSTIVNLTAVLGTAIVIEPIVILAPSTFLITLLFAVLANIVLLCITLRVKKLGKISGIILIALYLAFLLVLYIVESKNGLLPAP